MSLTPTRMITLWQGDPKLFLRGGGSYLQWEGGQTIMDAGLENAVFISLFTRLDPVGSPRGWAGNYLFDDVKVHIGSRFEEEANKPITLSSLTNVESAGEQALDWMIQSGLAREVTVNVTNPESNRLQTFIRVVAPDLTIQDFLLLKNGLNWIYQASDPAHRRA